MEAPPSRLAARDVKQGMAEFSGEAEGGWRLRKKAVVPREALCLLGDGSMKLERGW